MCSPPCERKKKKKKKKAVAAGGLSDHVPSGPALSLTRPLQRAVSLQQLFVEGAHAAAGERMQRLLQQREAVGRLEPVLVAVVIQTALQCLRHRARSPGVTAGTI